MRLLIIITPIGFLGSGRGGGVELTIDALVSGLLEQGHSVKVIAPKNSKLSDKCNTAELICVSGLDQDSWQHKNPYSSVVIEGDSLLVAMVEKALSLRNSADVILNLAYDWLPIWMTLNVDIPIAHLISMGNESFEIVNILSKLYSIYPNNLAFHSKIQASDYSFIKCPNIVGNGFHLDNYKFQSSRRGPLGWVGRVSPEKGLEDAVFVANKLGESLNVWGLVQDKNYAIQIEESYPPGTISWRGFLKTKKLQEELGHCRALLNTPKWNEAYGNVVVEAMACGVPVVAYKRGGPSEIIQHGKTGFLAEPDDKESLISFIKKIDNINREECRDWVFKNASSSIFADKITNWLEKVIKE